MTCYQRLSQQPVGSRLEALSMDLGLLMYRMPAKPWIVECLSV